MADPTIQAPDPFEQLSGQDQKAYSHIPPTTVQPEATLSDYGRATGNALIKGGASILDQTLGPTIENVGGMFGELHPGHPEEAGTADVAERNFPKVGKKGPDIYESGLTGAISNSPFGVGGALRGGIGGATTEARNYSSPNTPLANIGVGLAASAVPWEAPFKAGKAGLQAVGALKEDNPILSAEREFGITNRNAATIGDEKSWPKTIRDLRESVFSNSINDREAKRRQQIEDAFQTQAGPEKTQSQVGNMIQPELGKWQINTKDELAKRNVLLNSYMDPETIMVDGQPVLDRLYDSFKPTPGSPQLDPAAQSFYQKIKDSFTNYAYQQQYGANWQANKAAGRPLTNLNIPLKAIQEIRQSVGDDYEKGILNAGDLSVRHNRAAYGILADAESEPYKGTGFEGFRNDLKNDWGNYYRSLELVQPLLEEAGLSSGNVTSNVLAQAPKDADRIKEVFDKIPDATRNAVAGVMARKLAEGPDGNFNPATFAKKWNKNISPEAKDALFGPNKSAYDKLALLAETQADSEAARNNSKTAGVNAFFRMATGVSAGIAGSVLGYDKYQGNNTDSEFNYGNAGKLAAATTATTLVGMAAAARLFSSPGFVRYLATQPPIEFMPNKALPGGGSWTMRGLRTVGVNNPQLHNEIDLLNKSINADAQRQQQKQNDPFEQLSNPQPQQKFNAGGEVTWPDQSGNTGYVAGGLAGQTYPDNQYKEGGNVGDDYNTKLSPKEESIFEIWKKQNAPNDTGADYDLRGAFKKGLEKDSETQHWNDEFKKPNHPTFSDQSKYSKENPELPAGHWGGENEDIFQPPALYNEGGVSQRNFALGGLTQTRKPTQKKPSPVDYPWTGYAEGGASDLPASDKTAWMNNTKIATEDQAPKNMSVLDQIMNTKNLRNELNDKGLKGFLGGGSVWDDTSHNVDMAQGGIAHNKNDPRPFYNPQLPGVTGGGWKSGGFVTKYWGGGGVSDQVNAKTEI